MTQAESTPAVEDRHEAAREVIRQLGIGAEWKAVMDPDMPPALADWTRDVLDAYERVDLEQLLAKCHPDIEISQPPEVPDARVYRGEEALVDSLLDWPRQWEDFQMEPRRIFAADDGKLVMVSIHRGRPHSVDIEVEAEIVFAIRIIDGLVTRWGMFLTMDEALEA